MHAEFVNRPTNTVFYIRLFGDYELTPPIALKNLTKWFQEQNIEKSTEIYGMGLDNPHVKRSYECRFDACARVTSICNKMKFPEFFQEKELEGGRYAVFTHKGPYSILSEFIGKIYQEWHPKNPEYILSKERLLFCEYANYFEESSDLSKITKVYLPIQD